MFSSEISILLNTKNILILKFNYTDIFSIIPENTEPTDMPNDPEKILKKKKSEKIPKFFLKFYFGFKFSDIFGIES